MTTGYVGAPGSMARELDDTKRKLIEVRKERDELLAALMEAHDEVKGVHGPAGSDPAGCATCAVIARVDRDYDPSPYCSACKARKREHCHCPPIARNE